MKQNQLVCNFFAILHNGAIKKIDLIQNVVSPIRSVFVDNSAITFNDVDEIKFDGNYAIQENEILYVELLLPDVVKEVSHNAIGIEVLNLKIDKIKTLFWVEKDVYYFQNFDNRKLLKCKNVLFYNKNTFDKLNENAFIVEDTVNAIFKGNKFYFKSYTNANKIFSLLAFYQEATDEEIRNFATNDKLMMDENWLIENSNTFIRKQITLIQKSNILAKANPRKIKTSAKKFNLNITIEDGKVKLPNDKKICKDILTFLNEQYYIGLITGNKYRTNSKRVAS